MKFMNGRSVLLSGALGFLALTVSAQTASPPASDEKPAAGQKPTQDVAKELEEMKARIGQLEKELANSKAQPAEPAASATPAKPETAPATSALKAAPETTRETTTAAPAVYTSHAEAATPSITPVATLPADLASTVPVLPPTLRTPDGRALVPRVPLPDVPFPTGAPQEPAGQPAAPAAPPPVDLDTPFAFADFTWMMSNPRNHDAVLDGKYFSGEFRVDTNFMYDYNHPIDHTLTETTEGERTGEFVIQALNVGGDFHSGNMQGRVLTQFGAVSTAVPRNDASYSQGQWQLNDAYRYLSEMWAGYHINYKHGLNIQVGDFLSYIGLFSYYSFDNWTYQPSYVSSNTPWFFTGIRVQYFPTNKLKIEPWYINGWQTYAKYNGRPALGGQILYRPNGNWDLVFNTYTLGRDVLGNNKRSRYHADWSQEWKFYENSNHLLHRAGITVTEDFGCETGGGVVCKGGNAATPAQNFLGIMAYNRLWFDKDRFAFSYGGGVVNNPGRYLVLLPPINGANATTGSPYFTENPGDKFKGYDYQVAFSYMPSQWVTWHVEYTQRGANIPVFGGPGGITPQLAPGLYVNTGDPTQIIPGFTPDLRKQERRWIFALMVKL